jgi:hypothetical protein
MAANKLSKEDIKEVIDLYTNKEIAIKQIADKFNKCVYVRMVSAKSKILIDIQL